VSVQITTYERSTLVNDEKYIGLDVHQATIVVTVMDSTGKLVMESILETQGATILQFFAGLRGTLSVTFEEGTWSAWLYDLLHSRVDDPAGGRFEDHILYRPAHYDVECSRMLLPLLRNFNIDAFGLQSP
jgi:hypothetical protein